MTSKPTIRSLIQVNLIIGLAIGSLSLIFLVIARVEVQRAAIVCIMGTMVVQLIGLADILILGLSRPQHSYATLEKKQKIQRLWITYITSPCIYIIVWICFEPFIADSRLLWTDITYATTFTLSSWVMNTIIIIFYIFNFLRQSKIHADVENLQLKAVVSETSNQLLKQQIHPHFLFNVLNTVKTLYKQDVRQGEDYLVHLANFLRASLSDPTAKIVRLEDEIQLCNDYIEMQRIRFGCALSYNVDIPAAICVSKFVPYFALQTLLENAIKHNELTEESPLNIVVREKNGYIVLINNYQPKRFKEPSTGQGLSNLAERYRLVANEEIDISQDEDKFVVRIKLLDNEDSHH